MDVEYVIASIESFIQTIGAFFTGNDTSLLDPNFTKHASRFYPDPDTIWEPVTLSDGRTYYLLRNDPQRDFVVQRMLYLQKMCDGVLSKLQRTPHPHREQESQRLRKTLSAHPVVHIIQKPADGGYDVRAYAHGSWIFMEIPTFASIEFGTDGKSTTETQRRHALLHILLHECAHIAGYWEHDDAHEACLRWLEKITWNA